jgi:hypothetical protein
VIIVICGLGVCLIASMALNFKLIDELERVGKRIEELEEERNW